MKTDITIQKREVFLPSSIKMREEGDQANIIEGVAIVTNKETVLYEGSDWREIEVIDPSCIGEDFLREQDITLNLLHDRQSSIARTPHSLRIEPREDGLHFEADVPACDLGQRAQALIANGTYTGCSFEFWAKDYNVSERQGADGKTEYIIRHTAFEKIDALTIAMKPAYKQTSVSAREIYMQEHEENREEALKAEAEKQAEEEAQAQAAREAAEAKAREDEKTKEQIAKIRRETEMLTNYHN